MKMAFKLASGLLLALALLYASSINQTGVVARSDVTNQSTSQSAVTLLTSPPVGTYELHYYADVSTLCTTGQNELLFTFNWSDATAARALTSGVLEMPSASTTGLFLSGVIPMYVGSGNLTYSSTVTGTCATGTSTYDVHVWVKVN